MTVALVVALLWVVTAALFTAVTLVRLDRAAASVGGTPGAPPDVLLLRPVDEPTERELRNLAQACDYSGRLRHVVVSPYRPRLPAGVEWHFSDPVTPNRKVGHLTYALATLARPGEVALAVDADVAVDGALVAGLAGPVAGGAALSTAAPAPFGARGPGARAAQALLLATQHAFVPLYVMSLGARAICGKALGLGPEARALLPELGEHIGEDLELALRLHARSREVALSAAPARIPVDPDTRVRAAVGRFSRWMHVLRAHRPGLLPTVPWLLCPSPLLVVAALALRSPWLLASVAVLLGLRTALAVRLTRAHPEGSTAARDWFLGELLLLVAFVHSLGVRTVAWRGRRFRLLPGGRMQPAVEEP
ncbi:MAG TPA: glycosyltransferase [Myxococcaceae bacterium]|nr:glycosyltransferase [Myxococcaceae bacterium]